MFPKVSNVLTNRALVGVESMDEGINDTKMMIASFGLVAEIARAAVES